MSKKILGLILALCMTVSFAPYVQAATIVDSGTQGELNWQLDSAGTLTISGEGGIYRYMQIGYPLYEWSNKKDSIKKVVIEDGVTSIGTEAFSGCENLTEVSIPDTVKYIEDAFGSCTSLKSITIPKNVTKVDCYAFLRCENLVAIETASENNTFKSIDGVLFNKDGTELLIYPAGKSLKYTIPQSVETIGEAAFLETAISEIYIPQSVNEIQYSAFEESKLRNVTIPASVNTISEGAFAFCENLESITVEQGNSSYKSADGVLYNFDMTELIQYPGGKDCTYYMPDTVVSINSHFSLGDNIVNLSVSKNFVSDEEHPYGLLLTSCENLTTMFIPKSITYIYNNHIPPNIKDIYYEGSEADWENVTIDVRGNGGSMLADTVIHYNASGLPDNNLAVFTIENNIITNTDTKQREATIIIAEYNNGILKNVITKSETFNAGQSKSFSAPQNSKFFVWDSLSGMKPLTK